MDVDFEYNDFNLIISENINYDVYALKKGDWK